MHERSDSSAPPVARIAVIGASGSIGLAVCEALADDYEVVALTRFEPPVPASGEAPRIDWRQCDLFARTRVEADLAGCDVAIHLVHTRLPSARLDQAVCADMDLIIADNVARAAHRQGIEQIISLRGLLPAGELPPKPGSWTVAICRLPNKNPRFGCRAIRPT